MPKFYSYRSLYIAIPNTVALSHRKPASSAIFHGCCDVRTTVTETNSLWWC